MLFYLIESIVNIAGLFAKCLHYFWGNVHGLLGNMRNHKYIKQGNKLKLHTWNQQTEVYEFKVKNQGHPSIITVLLELMFLPAFG